MKFCAAVSGCDNPVFSKGFCRVHQYLRADYDSRSILQKGIDKRKKEMQNSNLKAKIRSLPKASEEDVISSRELSAWFAEKMKHSPKVCENCGKSLSALSEKDWKGSQHHILEKSIFTSVRTHPLNHLVLGRWCCHPQWHTSMLNASRMKIFPEANRKVVEMIPLLNKEEFRRVSEYYIIPL